MSVSSNFSPYSININLSTVEWRVYCRLCSALCFSFFSFSALPPSQCHTARTSVQRRAAHRLSVPRRVQATKGRSCPSVVGGRRFYSAIKNKTTNLSLVESARQRVVSSTQSGWCPGQGQLCASPHTLKLKCVSCSTCDVHFWAKGRHAVEMSCSLCDSCIVMTMKASVMSETRTERLM